MIETSSPAELSPDPLADAICGMPVRVLDAAFDLFGVLDESGAISDIRGRIFRDARAEPTQLVGQPFADSVFWQSSKTNQRLMEEAVETATKGEEISVRLDFRVSATRRSPIDVMLVPMFDAETKGIVVLGRSIGQGVEDRSQPDNTHLLLAANLGEIGLWYWDHETSRVISTTKCRELYGLAQGEELTYEKFIAAVHPADRAGVEAAFERVREDGARYEEEFRVLYSDGTIEWISAVGNSFLDAEGIPTTMVGVVRRITEEKEAAEELERVYELEKKAKNEAEVANRSKDFFLTFVSHELRSPLTAILGWSKILLQDRGLTPETIHRAHTIIEKSAQVQTKLINDLVDSARVTSGKIRLEMRPINVVDVLRSTFEAQRPAAENQSIEYLFESSQPHITVFGDSGRLQQVFDNLLSNALKYSDAKGSVRVKVDVEDRSVKIMVADSGMGIDPSNLPTIFRQFERGETERSRHRGGMGLGLSIVNILIGKHGGTVKAESDGPGRGAVFTVTLPLVTGSGPLEPPKAETPAVELPGKRLTGIRILIVEDDPDSREVLQIFLEQNGAMVLSADSAKTAFGLFNANNGRVADILISDLAMPEEDGYTLVSRIRELPSANGGDIPAVALSAFVSAESKQKAFDSGFDRYLTKPFDPDSIVVEILSLRSSKRGGLN